MITGKMVPGVRCKWTFWSLYGLSHQWLTSQSILWPVWVTNSCFQFSLSLFAQCCCCFTQLMHKMSKNSFFHVPNYWHVVMQIVLRYLLLKFLSLFCSEELHLENSTGTCPPSNRVPKKMLKTVFLLEIFPTEEIVLMSTVDTRFWGFSLSSLLSFSDLCICMRGPNTEEYVPYT